MAIEQLEHYTIRCRSLEATRDFYRDIIGLSVGPRPDFDFAGYWLYCGGVPIVHLVEAEKGEAGAAGGVHPTGALDHIAFRGSDPDSTIAKLKQHDIKFRTNDVPDFRLRQIFVQDPDGILVELNFRAA